MITASFRVEDLKAIRAIVECQNLKSLDIGDHYLYISMARKRRRLHISSGCGSWSIIYKKEKELFYIDSDGGFYACSREKQRIKSNYYGEILGDLLRSKNSYLNFSKSTSKYIKIAIFKEIKDMLLTIRPSEVIR
jgi:hypothetical protein